MKGELGLATKLSCNTEKLMTQAADKSAQSPRPKGKVPIAVIIISLNEAHNMEDVLDNLEGWAQEVFLVDSFSSDQTVNIALARGVYVVQRRFTNFGDQWNFALSHLPITAPWTMKLDPDERLTDELKTSIERAITKNEINGFLMNRRLWFMGTPLPVRMKILRLWRTGTGRFSDVSVNEHLLVEGGVAHLKGDLEHHDSPNLHHWYDKQNRYSTMEAVMRIEKAGYAEKPEIFGSALQRRMWLKSIRHRLPFRNLLMFLYCYFWLGVWRAGRAGFVWARCRADVYRMIDLKAEEMKLLGTVYKPPRVPLGDPNPEAIQASTVSTE